MGVEGNCGNFGNVESFHSFAPLMEDQVHIREKLLRGAEELFLKYGVRSVSMDDIARHLAVSKKTLYQYFIDKDEIVTQVAHAHLGQDRIRFDGIAAIAKNALDELMKINSCMSKIMQGMNPTLLFDLKKYHSKAWQAWMDHRNKHIRESVVRNIKQGIEEGLFRTNLNPDILAAIRIETIQMVFESQLFPADRYSLADVQAQALDHFMYGLLTEKGRKLYEKYKQEPVNFELIPHQL
jgi:TetR/AcrR family transcriptional regulator, cholesterol catabolism regulator